MLWLAISPDNASVINAVSKVLISCVITFLKTWPHLNINFIIIQAESTKTTINKVAIYFKDFI